MRPFGTIGLVALAFGLGSVQILEEWNGFNIANTALGAVLVVVGGVAALKRLSARSSGVDRGITLDAVLTAVATIWGALIVQLLISAWAPRFDWTFERRYELAPATLAVLQQLSAEGEVGLDLYFTPGDPRRRATRLLLDQMAHSSLQGKTNSRIEVSERDLDQSPEEEDFYGIGSSNSVVVRFDGRWELVQRPTEGGLYEALAGLRTPDRRRIYVAAGTGEGDFGDSSEGGFSGLRAALEIEGYELRPLPTALRTGIPEDADALLVVAPQRRMTDAALAATRAYLNERGGRLIAMLEPGSESGIEEILAEFGLTSPDAILIDPNSDAIEGDAAGFNPVANAYADHPVSRGLNANRMTFFRHARSFSLRKPQPKDRVGAAVYASSESWLHPDTSRLNRTTALARPDDVLADYHPLVVAGEYQRGGHQSRIVAFGDSTFASNRYLRALFNLDLAVNAVHWALEREPAITVRPKAGQLLQFPVPVQNALNALYGIGLLVPELLVMTGAWVWLRRHSA